MQGSSKADILAAAIEDSVNAHSQRLKERIRAVLTINETRGVNRDTVKKNFDLLDKMVVASALFQGRVRFLAPAENAKDDITTDFVELGLCGTVRDTDGGLAWTLAEPFAYTCVQDVFAEFKSPVDSIILRATQDLASVLLSLGRTTTARGLLVEPLEFAPFLGTDYQNKLVSEIPLLVQTHGLPKWCYQTKFGAKRYGNGETLVITNEREFLASAEAVGIILSPSNEMRPDGVLMLEQPPKHTAVVFGSALYTKEVPKTKVNSQELSTQLQLAYFLANGETVNPKRKKERDQFEQFKLHEPAGCLRIHFVLPRPPPNIPLDFCIIDGTDVAVNITSKHMHLLFPEEHHKPLLRLLAHATSTQPSDWGLPDREHTVSDGDEETESV